ncbi:MAG: hypothetical protein K1X89_07145 [Myxococcaceae bacterium]|nr:hypothetical protein [Myxococcaceae bacterium]
MSARVSVSSLSKLENLRYGGAKVSGAPITGALTQLAQTADGMNATKTKDNFADTDELKAYQATIDANTQWHPALKQAESERVNELLGYAEHPWSLKKDIVIAQVKEPIVAAGIALMMGAFGKKD